MGLVFGACPPIRRARQAQNPDKIPPGERTVTAAEAGVAPDSVLSLDRAIEIALAYNPNVVQARQSVVVAKYQYRSALAGYAPGLSADAGYQRATGNVPGQSPSNKSHNSYSADVNGSILLFDFWKTPSAVKQARAKYSAAEQSLNATINDTTYQVNLAYYGLTKAKALENVALDTVRQYQVHLDQTQELFNVGRRIKYDVTKAEVDLGNARLSLISAQNTVQTSRATLNLSIGLAEATSYQTVEPPLENADYNLEALMAKAREQNPQLRSLIALETAANAAVNQSISSLFPVITFGAGANWKGTNFPLVWNWAFGPTLQWNIFDGLRNLNNIDQATALLRTARAQRAALEQQIYLDLSTAVAKLQNARHSLTLSDLIVQQAQENLNLVDERFRVGRASSVELTDAQVALTSARASQVQARYDYQTAVAQAKHAIGGGSQ